MTPIGMALRVHPGVPPGACWRLLSVGSAPDPVRAAPSPLPSQRHPSATAQQERKNLPRLGGCDCFKLKERVWRESGELPRRCRFHAFGINSGSPKVKFVTSERVGRDSDGIRRFSLQAVV